MDKPWLSVIIPTFNGEQYLAQTLQSLNIQTCRDYEVILIDDGSDDKTLDIAGSFKDKLPLQIIANKHTGSWTENTNTGLELSKGKFVSILHQDDIWDYDRIKKIKDAWSSKKEAAVIVHNSIFISENDSVLGYWTCPFEVADCYMESHYVLERLIIQNFLAVPAVSFDRELAIAVNGLDSNFWYTGDWDLWLKLAKFKNWLYLKDYLAGFRVHKRSQTITGSDASDLNYAEQYNSILSRHSAEIVLQCPQHRKILRIAEFSASLNICLLSLYNHKLKSLFPVLKGILCLGPRNLIQYFKISRIIERFSARLALLYPESAGQSEHKVKVFQLSSSSGIKQGIDKVPYA